MARAVPPALVAKPAPEPKPARLSPAALFAPILIAALLLAGAALSRQGGLTGLFGQNVAVVMPASIVHLPVVHTSGTGAEQAVVPDTGGAPQAVAGVACPLPEGWVPYTVNPTDSLFRLSILHGITLDEIRNTNCLGEDAVLLPSQVIYVPRMAAATLTPFAAKVFPTSVPLQIVNPPVQVAQPEPADDDDGDSDEEPAQPPPPPPAKPTAVVTDDPTDPPPPAPTDTPPPNSGGRDDDDDDDDDDGRGRGDKGGDDDDDDRDRGGGRGDDDDDDRDRGGGGRGDDDRDDDRDRGGGGRGDDDDDGKGKGRGGGKKGKD